MIFSENRYPLFGIMLLARFPPTLILSAVIPAYGYGFRARRFAAPRNDGREIGASQLENGLGAELVADGDTQLVHVADVELAGL